MRNWPVILVLLVVMLGLIIAGQINRAKSDDFDPPGCLDDDVTTPEFMVVRICGRTPETTGGNVGRLDAVRKTQIISIGNYVERTECSYIRYPGGRILVHGTIARLLVRSQPYYIDWGSCGPTVEDFIKNLESDMMKDKPND